MEHLLVDGGEANFQCRNVASGCGCVRAYDRESMKNISLGSQFVKTQQNIKQHMCKGFFMEYDIWLW